MLAASVFQKIFHYFLLCTFYCAPATARVDALICFFHYQKDIFSLKINKHCLDLPDFDKFRSFREAGAPHYFALKTYGCSNTLGSAFGVKPSEVVFERKYVSM